MTRRAQITLVLACMVALPLAVRAVAEVASYAPDPELLHATHQRKGSFFNPWIDEKRSVWRMLRWQFSSNPYDKSAPVKVGVVPNDGSSLAGFEPGAAVTWVGHATFAVHEGHDVFLTDPHFSKRALIPARKVPPGIPISSVPVDAFAVISHNHYDHLDEETVRRLPKSVQWFVPLGLAEWFHELGQPNVVELDWWQSATRGAWTITCLPAQHWSRRLGQAENESLWCSWLLDSGARRYYFAGDTGYFHGFAEFGRRFGPIDVAMLPIGAYEPRWFMSEQHMDPAQSYQAFKDLAARVMLPMHWGTFDLTDEPVDYAPKELAKVLDASGGDARVHVFEIGERWQLPDAP